MPPLTRPSPPCSSRYATRYPYASPSDRIESTAGPSTPRSHSDGQDSMLIARYASRTSQEHNLPRSHLLVGVVAGAPLCASMRFYAIAHLPASAACPSGSLTYRELARGRGHGRRVGLRNRIWAPRGGDGTKETESNAPDASPDRRYSTGEGQRPRRHVDRPPVRRTSGDDVGEDRTSRTTPQFGRPISGRSRPGRHSLESILSQIYTGDISWDVRLWEDVESWVLGLDDETYNLVAAAIIRLESEGPTLGRPTADRIKGSRHHNMNYGPDQRDAARSEFCSPSIRSAEPSCLSPETRQAGGSSGTTRAFRSLTTGSTNC